MRQLLWKDFRLNRSLLLLGTGGLASIYAIGLVLEITSAWPALPTAKSWADALCSYGHMSLGGIALIAALLGGNAIASERADRTAHFLAYLPLTKLQILASKALVIVLALALFWGSSCVVIYVLAPLLYPEPLNYLSMLGPPSGALASCILTCGVGWFFSALLEKPTFPVLAALASPVVLSYGLFTFSVLTGVPRLAVFEWAGFVGAGMGAVSFLIGSWYYCRRIEP